MSSSSKNSSSSIHTTYQHKQKGASDMSVIEAIYRGRAQVALNTCIKGSCCRRPVPQNAAGCVSTPSLCANVMARLTRALYVIKLRVAAKWAQRRLVKKKKKGGKKWTERLWGPFNSCSRLRCGESTEVEYVGGLGSWMLLSLPV